MLGRLHPSHRADSMQSTHRGASLMSSTKPVFLSEALRELRAHFGEDITIPHMLSLSIGRETAPGADSVVDGAPVKLPPWYWGCLHDWSPENDAADRKS